MAAFSTIIAGIGLAIGAVGAYTQYSAAKDASKASAKAEQLRAKQMNLEAARNKRDIVRKMIQARALAVSNASNQNALGGSGLQGGIAQITGESAQGILATNQNQEIGSGIFAANEQVAVAQGKSAFGEGLGSLGGALVRNSGTIAQVGTYLTTPKAKA